MGSLKTKTESLQFEITTVLYNFCEFLARVLLGEFKLILFNIMCTSADQLKDTLSQLLCVKCNNVIIVKSHRKV